MTDRKRFEKGKQRSVDSCHGSIQAERNHVIEGKER